MSSSNMNTSSTDSPRVILGQVYVTNPRPWWVPVGLEATQGPGAKPLYYRSPFFGGDREYVDDEDGWTVVRNGRRHRRTRKPRKMMIVDDNASVF